MTDWQTKTLGEVLLKTETVNPALAPDVEFDYIDVSSVSNSTYAVEATQRLRGSEAPSRARRLVREGDVILATIRPTLKRIAVIPPELDQQVCSTGYFVLRPCSEIDHRFLFYYLFTEQFMGAMERLQKGASYPAVTDAEVRAQPISFPGIQEQRRIVAILDEAFEGIATAKANAEKNLQNARELAEAMGEACFNKHVDAHFQPRDLASLCEFIVDCEHKTAPTQKDGYPSIRTPNIGKGRLILDDVNRVSEETYVAWTRRAVPLPGDLILAREAPAGNVAVIPEGMLVCLGQRTVLIRPLRQLLEPDYLAHLLLRRSSQQRLLAHSRGATVQHVNLKDIRAFQIGSVPSLDVQRRVIDELAAIGRSCCAMESVQKQKQVALDELEKSLLHQAFTGQLSTGAAIPVKAAPPPPTSSPQFSAAIISLAHERHLRRQRDKTFGHVKQQKLLHLVEALAGMNLGRQPIKDAAGPNDFPHQLRADNWARQNGFYDVSQRDSGGYDFKRLSGFDKLLHDAPQVLGASLGAIESVIDLLIPMDSQEAELLATVHAAWNNLLIDGAEATDEAIVRAARDAWHADKLKIPAAKFHQTIALIRAKGLVPDGSGKYVGGQERLL
jgi:restriction endonuclease S subunit